MNPHGQISFNDNYNPKNNSPPHRIGSTSTIKLPTTNLLVDNELETTEIINPTSESSQKLTEESFKAGVTEAVKERMKILGKDPLAEGQKEATKEQVKEEEINKQKFDQVLDKSVRVLFKAQTFWPFDLFPDDITVDLNQVNIVIREFFYTERRHAVYISNISDVFVDTGLFFASLNIIDKGFVENTISIPFLTHHDAKKARRIIQGLIVADKQGIDLCNLDDQNLVSKVEELGRITAVE